jgi:hypothetical protein
MRHCSISASLILALASTFSATAQQPASTQPSAQSGSRPTVKLLNPGASPRQTLRLTPRAGTTGVINLTMHITARQILDGTETPQQPSPGVLMSFATTVTEIHGERINYTFECVKGDLVEDPSIPPAILDAIRGGINMVVGLRGTGVLSDRAVSLDATVTTFPGMDPALLTHASAIDQLLEQITTPLPAEPVGVGARWEVANTIDQDGVTLYETIICTLAASDGNTVEILMAIERHASPQPVRDPNMPPGASADLRSYAFAGAGRTILRLDRLHPVEATVDVTSDSTMQMTFGTVSYELKQHVVIATELEQSN